MSEAVSSVRILLYEGYFGSRGIVRGGANPPGSTYQRGDICAVRGSAFLDLRSGLKSRG